MDKWIILALNRSHCYDKMLKLIGVTALCIYRRRLLHMTRVLVNSAIVLIWPVIVATENTDTEKAPSCLYRGTCRMDQLLGAFLNVFDWFDPSGSDLLVLF